MTYAFANRSDATLGIVAAFLLLSLALPRQAPAETLDCTPINELPAVITLQGIYCLTRNLITSQTEDYAIEIQTNNVTIDFNGWKLGGLSAGSATHAYGIYSVNRKNITIRNGTVRGFSTGIFLGGVNAQGNLVEDIRAEQNRYGGIETQGRGDIIRRNQVVDTGGGVSLYGNGIKVTGAGARVLDNDVVGVTATGLGQAYGIYLGGADGAVVESNRVSEIANLDTGSSMGIALTNSSSGLLIAGNRINGPITYGIWFSSSTGGYSDNKVIEATTDAFFGGTDYGGNKPDSTP